MGEVRETVLYYRYGGYGPHLWRRAVGLRVQTREDGQSVNACKGVIGTTGLSAAFSRLPSVFKHQRATVPSCD